MSKKWIWSVVLVLAIVAIGVGIYIFVFKGFSNGTIKITPIVQNQPSTETGSIASNTISLDVTSPIDGETLSSTNATVTGKTVPSAEVFVNDATDKADTNGNFSINISLDEGQNEIVVSANDANGNVAEKDLTVTVASFQ